MKKITSDMTELQSMNITEDNISKLNSLFPEAFNENGIDFDVLKQLLGENVDEKEERYGLNWHGKRQARQLALTPSRGTLRPCKDESVDWDNTKNLMIEGDNLEVLKLLQKSYAGKVKLIYIDPPYNTGKDFVYSDNFQDNMKNYLEITGQTEEGTRLSTNTETSGRYHTDWLNMIYPRLKLAKNLLRNDGVIIISIDDSELNNLKIILDEIFGGENNLATLVWDRNRKNDAKYFSVGHEYMLVYARNESYLTENEIIFRGAKEGVDYLQDLFNNSKLKHGDNWELIKGDIFEYYKSIPKDDPKAPLKRFTKIDEKGPYRDDGNINWPGGNGPTYEIIHPKTGKACKLPTSGWRYPTEVRFWEEYEKGKIVFGDDENTVPRIRTNLFENSDQVMTSVHYSYAQTAANEFSTLFDGERVFSHPKPVNDIKSLIGYLTNTDDLIVDFFAGSGTSGHSVFLQNANDDASRRFILVQLPELFNQKNKEHEIAYDFCERMNISKNIAEITKERLRRAGKKVRKDNPEWYGDIGFRVFKLDTSNIRPWEATAETLSEQLDAYVSPILEDRSEEDLLTELMLKRGIDLSVNIETRQFDELTVSCVDAGKLFTCFANQISASSVEELTGGIIDWHKSLKAGKDTVCYFLDNAFENNVAKTNLCAILEQHGLTNLHSL
ncbi:site-specific DNA-methyltransferase [Erwinia tracheiphila]|uniref:site-specific DNA-methyltransferase (adenine-specific) n=1 Tax=Erwinia tracheiphila TaxID=65700 RepID=A0A345CQ34_9GAMM|nr:site-specific DNA-methyltransferase [Erwinia tracheiphila]AXF75551.1 site-specific DNA-methyltransferase [Erwinia tracheiphila]UIA81901.1 site-specific DNA-methyltransferase [Erwinia tracheiphila]UIA90497.1 site-specific DNA-methyltransferase [Erwinia tracheiphila]